MDIKDIKDITVLKSYAFDCIQRIEIEQQNLRALQLRIEELSKKEK